jgi:hypothetical protein
VLGKITRHQKISWCNQAINGILAPRFNNQIVATYARCPSPRMAGHNGETGGGVNNKPKAIVYLGVQYCAATVIDG